MDIKPPITTIIFGQAMTGKTKFLRKKAKEEYPDYSVLERIHYLGGSLEHWSRKLIDIIKNNETVLIDELTIEASEWIILMGILSKYMTEDRKVYIVTQSIPPDILNRFPNTAVLQTEYSERRRKRPNPDDDLYVTVNSALSINYG